VAVDLLSLREVLERTHLSERTFYRIRERGEFPLPVKLAANARLVVWRSDDVAAWCMANPTRARVQRDP